MAERRMFAKSIIDSDAFLEMPQTTQNLYFHLSMRADDDGFINNPKSIMRTVGCSNDDMSVLIARQFLIPFESGVVVVRHWKIHNYIRNDRYKETKHIAEKRSLKTDETNAYIQTGIPTGIPLVSNLDTQDRLGKVSVGKDSIDICSAPLNTKPTRHKYGEYQNVLLSDEELEKLKAEFPNDWEERIERLSEYIASTGKKYKNFLATIRNWSKKDSKKGIKNYGNTTDNGNTQKFAPLPGVLEL